VGSAGGNLTMAACCFDIWGAAAGGAATLGGGGDCCACGGGVTAAGAATVAATGVTGSAALGVSSTLGAALAGAPSNNLLKYNIYEINYKKLSLPVMVIVHKSCPALTVAPSSTSRFSITPLTGEGTGTDVLKN